MLTQVAAELAARNTLATQARMAKGEVYGASFAITARLRTFTYPLIDFGHNGKGFTTVSRAGKYRHKPRGQG